MGVVHRLPDLVCVDVDMALSWIVELFELVVRCRRPSSGTSFRVEDTVSRNQCVTTTWNYGAADSLELGTHDVASNPTWN